jgi:hypothetical protein
MAETKRYLTSVDPESGYAQLDNGERIPITNMYDAAAQDTTDPALCQRGVAGPCSEGNWYPFTCDLPED